MLDDHHMEQYDLTSAPVVNSQKRLIGMVTVDDVVEVIQEEAEEDMLKLAGTNYTVGVDNYHKI